MTTSTRATTPATHDDAASLVDALLPVISPDMDGERAEWSTAYQNDLPDSAFAYVEKGGTKDDEGKTTPRSLRHFPIRDADGDLDEAHVRNALARLPTAKLPAAALAKIKRTVTAAAKKLGIAVSDDAARAIDAAIILADDGLRAAVLGAMAGASDMAVDVAAMGSAGREAQTLHTTTATQATFVMPAGTVNGTADAGQGQVVIAPIAPIAAIATRAASVASNPNTIIDGHAVAWAPITRVDAERREIEGVMTDEQVDTFGTIFDYDTMKRVVQEAWAGNIREQHDRNKAVGRKVDVSCDDATRSIRLRARISEGATDTWHKILDGTLAGFSIGAADVTVLKHRMVGNRSVPVLAPKALAEVSVVDAPSNPGAASSGLVVYRNADGGLTDEGERMFDDYGPVEAAIAAIVAETDAARAHAGHPTPEEAADDGLAGINAPAAHVTSGTATGDDIDHDDDKDMAGNAGGASYDDPAGSAPIHATAGDPGVQDATAGAARAAAIDAPEAPAEPTAEPTGPELVGADVTPAEAIAQAQAEAERAAKAAGKSAKPPKQPKGKVNDDGEGGRDGGTGSGGDDGEGGDEDDGGDGESDADEDADTTRASDGVEVATDGPSPRSDIDWQARDERIAGAEKAITKESGHAHPAHDHEHASGYEVVHFHDHAHEHLDGTKHAHPHMHAHDHHDHYGDPTHTHPHTHTHDHSHEYRAWAPDQSRVQEPQPVVGAAQEAAVNVGTVETVTPAPASAPVVAEDGRVLVGVTSRADDVAATVVEHTHDHEGHVDAVATVDAPEGVERTQEATEATQEPEATRVGARVSAATRDKLHAAIVAALDACACDICADATSLFDPDGDGDDAADDDGARVQAAQTTRRAERMQRIAIAHTTRAVVEAEMARALSPIVAQMRGIAARLAAVETPAPVALATATLEESPIVADVAAMRAQMGDMAELLAAIAAQPQTGNAPIVQAGAAHKALLGDTRAVMDASVMRSATGNPALDRDVAVAEAIATLRANGMLPAATIPQEMQIGAAAALIQSGRPR